MSSKNSNKIKDSYIWLIPAGTLTAMIIACCVAIIMLINTGLPGLFSQIDLGVTISQESLDSFAQKANIAIDSSIAEKSLSTHKYICQGETFHEELPISSDEFSSFIAYTMPGDFPIKSTQVKFNDGGVEMSAKVKLSDFIDMFEEGNSESGSTDDPTEPLRPFEPDEFPTPEDPENSGSLFSPAAIRTMDLFEPTPSEGDNDSEDEDDDDSDEEGLKELMSLLPNTVNVYVKGTGVIVNNEIADLRVDVLNLSGFNLTDFVDEETAYELSKAIINGILDIMNEQLNVNFAYAVFTADSMVFTGTMPESITMVEK